MAKKYMTRCSTSLITREMQVKITIMYHLTPVRMTITKRSTNNKFWRGCGEKRTPLNRRWECKLLQPPWKIRWRLLKKLNIEQPYYLAIPFLGIYPERTIIENIHAPKVHCSTIYSSQDMEATKISIDREMDKEDVVLSCKKE